jgi:hypothetical protein
MIKYIIIVVIIFLVYLLINDDSCENYSGLDIQGNAIPCYEAIKYQNLEKSREYNANDVYYNDGYDEANNDGNNDEGYDFSNENVPLSNSVIPMPSM